MDNYNLEGTRKILLHVMAHFIGGKGPENPNGEFDGPFDFRAITSHKDNISYNISGYIKLESRIEKSDESIDSQRVVIDKVFLNLDKKSFDVTKDFKGFLEFHLTVTYTLPKYLQNPDDTI